MKLFNLWDTTNITLTDLSLKNNLTIKPQLVAKNQGRNASQRFHKNKTNIVERLITRLMVPGHRGKKHKLTSGRNTGKYHTNAKLLIESFKIIEEKTKQNPLQILMLQKTQ